MKKIRAPFLLTAFVLAASFAAAEDPAPTPTPVPTAEPVDAAKVILAPKKDSTPAPAVDSDGVTRSVSPGIAQALSEGMPKFSPPTPTPAAQEEDKPKNGIIRLPAYLVRERRPPIFRPRDLYTPAGLVDLTFKAHPGLIFGNILGLNEGAAAQMYLEDQRVANMDDLTDEAHAMTQGGDRAEGALIMKESADTYMRGGAWDWDGTGPVGSLTGAGK